MNETAQPKPLDALNVAAWPMPVVWADIPANLKAVDAALELIDPSTDLLVLPELFSTGFIQDEILLKEIASESERLTLEAMRRWASERDMAVAGSFLVERVGKYYNRAAFVEPSGKTTFYDKRHLFCLSAESTVYSQGQSLPPVIVYRGWNISMIVCYDLRFPVWCRNDGQSYDILLVPANWASARGYAFHQLLIARAIENQAFVVGCNRGGADNYGTYDNESYILNPFGYEMAPVDTTATKGIRPMQLLAEKKPTLTTPAGLLTATFTRSALEKVRSYLPVGRDADSFTLHL